MCIYSNMYVYLALLLGIVLVVWIYRRFLVKIEPFDLLTDGVTKQVYNAQCWNNRSCAVGPNDVNKFSPFPPGYSIFPIRITQTLLTRAWIRIRSNYGSGCGDTPCWAKNGSPDIDWSDVTSINEIILYDTPVKLSGSNPSMKFRTSKTATTTYVDNFVHYSGANWDTLRDHTVVESDDNNAKMQVYGTTHLFNTDFKYYRPATSGELAWLKLNSSNNSLSSYILPDESQRSNVETENSQIQFIVGPTPNKAASVTTDWITHTSPNIDHREIINKELFSYPSFYDAYNYWSKFNYKYTVYIVGNPISSFNVPGAPNINEIQTIGNNYAQSIDTDIVLNSSDPNTYTPYINTNVLGPILRKYRLSGTVNFSRGCNTTNCKTIMQKLQNTYTGYNLQALPECAGCLARDYTDISGVWKLADRTEYGNGIVFTYPASTNGIINASLVASDFTRNRAPTNTPMYLPAQTVSTDEEYVFQLYRVNRDASWSSSSTLTPLLTTNEEILEYNTNKFTVPANTRFGTFTVNLNTREITFPNVTNGTFRLPANTFFYHTYTSNDKIGTVQITSDPVYVLRIYKRPQSSTWNVFPDGAVSDIVFDGWFGVPPRKIVFTTTSLSLGGQHVATFKDVSGNPSNTVSLPPGDYKVTLKARNDSDNILIPDNTLSFNAPSAFTGFTLNFSGVGTLTLTNTENTVVELNEVYALRDGGVPKFTIEITPSTGGNPLFAMDPVAINASTYLTPIGMRSGTTNYDVIFNNNYNVSVYGSKTLGFYLSHSKAEREVTASFSNVSNVIGYRVKLNTSTGTSAFVFLTTGLAEIPSTLTPMDIIFTYGTVTNLAVDIVVAERQIMQTLPANNIPITVLTIGKNTSTSGSAASGLAGQIQLNNVSVVLKTDNYTVSVDDSTTNPPTNYYTLTDNLINLNNYVLTPPKTLLLYAFNSSVPATKELTRQISNDTTLKLSVSNTKIGTINSQPFNVNAIKISSSGVLDDNNGYIISGTFTQDGNNITLTNKTYTIDLVNTIGENLYNIQNISLNNATGYELNISKNTLKFIGTNVLLNLPQPFVSKLTDKGINLQLRLDTSISYETPFIFPDPVFTITQSSNGILYTYEFPEHYALIPNPPSDYNLTLKADGEFGPTYGVMVFKPTATTRKFTVNINTGEVTFISTSGTSINKFDVQGLRESRDKQLVAFLTISGVIFPPSASTITSTIKSTQFGTITNNDVYSDSASKTNVRVSLGAQTGSLSGSQPPSSTITPVSQLEPNTNYTLTVTRGANDILYQSDFRTGVNTTNIAGVNYNRDDNTIAFVNAAGVIQTLPNTPNLLPNKSGSADLLVLNNETIKITITQVVNYSSTAFTGSDRTASSNASPTKKTIMDQKTPTNFGNQTITTSWDAGYVLFTLTNGLGKTTILPPREYEIMINNKRELNYRFNATSQFKHIRLHTTTGQLEVVYIDNTKPNLIISANTGLVLTSQTTLSASLYLVFITSASQKMTGSVLYNSGNTLTLEPHVESCKTITVPNTQLDVFVLLNRQTNNGFTRAEATSISISGLDYATIDDVKAIAKAGANWYTPGWILTGAGSNKPPVYPINEYSEIQIYAVPHREYFTTNAPGPLEKGPYVISYLPPPDENGDIRAGILVKGDRTKVSNDFKIINFNTYTGQETLKSVAPSNEIFHIRLPENTDFYGARTMCHSFGGDIALTSTVDTEGLKVPIGAQWPMYGFMYKIFASNDASNLVRMGHPKQPTTDKKTGVFVLEGNYTTASTANGVICYGSKKNMDRGKNELKFDTSGNPISSTTNIVSDYNYDRHIWSAYESVSPLAYESYMPKNIQAISKEPNAYYKAAMIVNDGRAQPNIVFARGLQDAERYAGCDVRYMTCIAKSSDDPEIEKKYVEPTSSTGKWVNVDLEEARLELTESFQGSRDAPLPAPGMARMMSDMELFGRTPVALEGLVGGVGELGVEDRPQIPLREPFVDGKVGVDDATRQAVNDILDCQAVGGAVNITQDGSVYPGCNTICCFPDDGRKLDPSLIKNRRKTSGPGAATCDDEGGCTEKTSKAPIRHTPAPAAYRLKKKTDGPAATAPAPKCASATPLRTQVANAKRDKLEALRNKPVN